MVVPDYAADLSRALTTIYRLLTGRSGGEPPEDEHDKGWVIVLLIMVWILFLVFLGWLQSRLPFTIKTLLLMVLICFAPIASVEWFSKRRVSRVVVETLMVIAVVSLFLWSEFGSQPIGTWILYTALIVFVLQVGSHVIEYYKDDSIARLSGWSEHWEFLKGNTFVVNQVFRRQQITYLSVPLGFLVGLQVGLVQGYSNAATVAACLIAILLLASISLVYFLINSFLRMIDPIFVTQPVSAPVVQPSVPAGKVMRLLLGLHIEIVVPPDPEEKHEERDLELSHAATILRKIYLFDSIHNVVLVSAFVGVMLSFLEVRPTTLQIVLGLLVVTFLFCQVPYSVGQMRLHRKVLRRFRGIKEVELSEKLGKVAPRFPAFQLLTSLATSGTGSFLYYLLEEFIKNRLKPLAS